MHVKFSKLPADVQDRLRSRQRGEGEVVVVKTGDKSPAYILMALAIGAIALLFYLTDNDLWHPVIITGAAIVTLAAVYILISNIYRIFSSFSSRTYLLITPVHVIEISGNNVGYWSLGDLMSVNSAHDYQNGHYSSTKFTLSFKTFDKTFRLYDINEAEDTLEKIEYLRKTFIEAQVREKHGYLEANDDLRGVVSGDGSNPTRKDLLAKILVPVFSLIISAGIVYAAVAVNNYFDDKRAWDVASVANRASAVRSYVQTHPRGRWKTDAERRLQSLYDAAEQKYQDSLNKGYDKKAASAVLSILKYARSSEHFKVKVVFERHNEIPPDVSDQLKKHFEVKNVLPLGDVLSDEKMNTRESKLLASTANAFRRIIPDDILEFSSDCEGECVNFLVKYTIDAGDSIYYDDRQKKLPHDQRTFYPGIFINWDFRMAIPGQSENYDFELGSLPANEISYDLDNDTGDEKSKDFDQILKSDLSHIYDSMVASAFDDFEANLVYKMGIGSDEKLNINHVDDADPDEDNKNNDDAPPGGEDKGVPVDRGSPQV